MLVLSRSTDEAITIGDDVEIKVLSVAGGKVKLGIDAPRSMPIVRKDARSLRPRP
jgi:carbon storage regulator